MFRFTRSALLGLAALSGLVSLAPAGAQAAPIGELQLVRDHHGPGRDHRRSARWDRGCSARLALSKARDMGLRRAGIVRETRRVVQVEGLRRHGRPVLVTFAQSRGCPVINRR